MLRLTKQKITGTAEDEGTKNVKLMVPLKYLSNFWRTFKMSLIKWEINLMLNWSKDCIISNAAANQETTLAITDTKLYVPVVILSPQDNVKPLQQLKSSFKRIINSNKYRSKTTTQAPNRYFDYLIDPNLQGVDRPFILTFDNNMNREGHARYYLPTIEMKDCNFINDGKNLFDQTIKYDVKTYNNIRKITTGQGDDYINVCLLGYNYFEKYFSMITIDLRK